MKSSFCLVGQPMRTDDDDVHLDYVCADPKSTAGSK